MHSIIVSEQERHMLQALLSKGTMTQKQLSELCKNAFGWSGAVIRRTQKSLLKQGLITLQDGQITPTVTKEVLEDNSWDHLVSGTFEWVAPTQPKQKEKPSLFRNIWFWCTCAAVAVIVVLIVLWPATLSVPVDDSPVVEVHTIPEELLVCKEALDKWQALSSCKITSTVCRYSNSGTTTQWVAQYWVSEKDWVLINYAQGVLSSLTPSGYMYRNGIFYSSNYANTPIWKPQPDWQLTRPEIWPMCFDWDNHELFYTGTTRSDSSSVVSFTAVNRTQEETPTVYQVQFHLTLRGELSRVVVIQIWDNDIISEDVYYLSSSDADEIAQFIADQHEVIYNPGWVPEDDAD